ncbi:MAG: Na+/H+ antiporter subunit E [Leptolyngbyaceae cyanobacterium MAG.088]|nr:Na+/H+ antiporter subunit E [Leptolyngbyaceae cyanobacterium MAG.088]
MIGLLEIALRLGIWFLLTADFSLVNVLIGVAIALLLPRATVVSNSLQDWLRALKEVAMAIPQAFIEAIEIMVRPHRYESRTVEKVKGERSPGLIFLDVFLITFTPKTIVTKYHGAGLYEVHRIARRRKQP